MNLTYVRLGVGILAGGFVILKWVQWQNRLKRIRIAESGESVLAGKPTISYQLGSQAAAIIPDFYVNAPLGGWLTSFVVTAPSLCTELMSRPNTRRWLPGLPAGSLFTSEGDDARRHKVALGAAMKRNWMELLRSTVHSVGDSLGANVVAERTVPDFYKLAESTIADAIRTLTYGENMPTAMKTVSTALSSMSTAMAFFMPRVFLVLTPSGRRVLRDRAAAETEWKEYLNDIRTNKDGSLHYRSLAAMLVTANDEAGSPLSDEELRQNAISFGVGGNDSTASALVSCVRGGGGG
jgi:cytochrome P450